MGDCTLYRTDPQLLMLLYYTITPPWRNNPPGLDSHRPAPFRKDFLLKALHHQQQVFRVARCLFFVFFFLFLPFPALTIDRKARVSSTVWAVDIDRARLLLLMLAVVWLWFDAPSGCWGSLNPSACTLFFFPSYRVRYRDPANGTVRDRDNNCLFIPLYFFILSSVYLR